MLLLEGNKISFQYDKQTKHLLNDVSFFINSKSKIGLIGKNGVGKSTLFKLILGTLTDYTGVLSKKEKIRIGYLPQDLRMNESFISEDYLWQARPSLLEVKKKIDTMGCDDKSYIHLFSDYEELGGYTFEVKVEKVLGKFKLDKYLLENQIKKLSGGEKTKLALAKIILSKPDLILFDEPTNHLDIQTLKWLEDYLSNSNIPFIIISHDREFLDYCVQEIWEIKASSLRRFSGNYSFYKEKTEEEYEKMMQEYECQQKKVKQLTLASNKRRSDANKMENFKHTRSIKKNGGICKRDDGSGSNKANPTKKMQSAKAVEKRIEIMLEKEKAKKPTVEKRRRIHFTQNENTRSKIVFQTELLSKSYSKILFQNVSLSLNSRQRLGVIGRNGIGKTTLLKILMGLEKQDYGNISISPSISISYYAQDYENLNFKDSIINEVIGENKQKETFARTILGCLGIKKEKVFQKIESLSVGERSKVSLVKSILSGANLLILDEPTNHLEIDAKEVIEDALKSFDGTIIFVSHDRKFIEEIGDILFDLEHNQYFDNFLEYMNFLGQNN